MPLSIIIADDHPIILTGIRNLIEISKLQCNIVAEAYQASELLEILKKHHCDILVTDFSMPGDKHPDGLAMIQRLRRDYPTLPIIILTQIQNIGILQTLIQLGVSGILLKKAVVGELSEAIQKVSSGHCYISPLVATLLAEAGAYSHSPLAQLTPRESEVVRLLSSGMSVTKVAEYLNRSVKTISTQKNNAMQRLGLKSDSALFHYAQEQGLI
ncbi:response regulator [Aeromonas hydrophila]|uniref:response regulator n=1 Tax=Aeromonas hydrophila TaxID=644 RepID=UPI001C5BC86A|nr:response regulator [Aeromonas hydrophila]MBW3811399.1 response regulator [Aeromonas hydrophila]